MGDIVESYNIIVQYPRDIVTDVGEAEKDTSVEQPLKSEEQLVESEVVNSRSLEENLGQNIDVTV